ncbi:MAG: BON domain-containing protein [Rhizonema sp. PD38]|nr:BON domain-containing protein [Rhizonema sp. PD38]
MKKLSLFLLSSILLLGTVACQDTAKTSANAPDSTKESTDVPDAKTVEANKDDAQSQMRRNQLNADIRAHEERNNAFNKGGTKRTDAALATEVRDKLEANIPGSQLLVDAKDGVVTISGNIFHSQNMKKIELAKQIKGVKSVVNNVKVVQPKTKS